MRKIFILITAMALTLACLIPSEGRAEFNRTGDRYFAPHPTEMTIRYPYSAFFRIQDQHAGYDLGTVVKKRDRLWRVYQYYGTESDHDLIAWGYLQLDGIGQMFTWAGTLCLKNANNEDMGYIEGKVMTLRPSWFDFYDAEGKLLGSAEMDKNAMGYTVTSASNDMNVAKYTRISIPGNNDYWYLDIYDKNAIPPSMLVIFGSFIIENQSAFRIDN